MKIFERSLSVLEELFAKDYQFALATSKDNLPSVRFIDAYYDDGAFYIVTHAKSQKTIEIENNPKISMCNELYRFSGTAINIGHPLLVENSVIREKLIKVFEPWYFAHNNENDENMCYIKIKLERGFFYLNGTGYKVDFQNKEAEEFPFTFEIVIVE